MMTTPPRVIAMRHAIGQNIRTVRKHRKLRLFDLSLRTGFSIPKLCRIEKGREVTGYDDVRTISEALGVKLGSLLPPRVRIVKIERLDFGGEWIA